MPWVLACKVVAHVVIPMDRMYNGRAGTMNTIASGSLMRWIALAFQQRAYTALVRACAVYTACLLVYHCVALAVQCETTHGVYEFRRGFCTSVLLLDSISYHLAMHTPFCPPCVVTPQEVYIVRLHLKTSYHLGQ